MEPIVEQLALKYAKRAVFVSIPREHHGNLEIFHQHGAKALPARSN
jgi:hypothetical protein